MSFRVYTLNAVSYNKKFLVSDNDTLVLSSEDTRSRLLAAMEVRLLYAVAVTILLYALGPRIMGALLRCW